MLGEVLRTERERRQLTIQDIEEATSIRAIYIEAIENGDYKKLPGEVYTKGFIRNYATFLNLEGDALVKQFEAEITPPPIVTEEVGEENKIDKTEKQIEKETIPAPTEKMPPQKIIRRSERKSSGGSNFGLVAAVVLIAALAGGVWYYFTTFGSEVVDIDLNPKIDQPADVNENQPVAQGNDTQKPNAVSAAPNQLSGVNVQAKFSGECWTQVTVDGVIVYEDVAVAGQNLTWEGKDSVTVRVGNAGAVEFTENGKSVGQTGAVGEVVEKTFRRS